MADFETSPPKEYWARQYGSGRSSSGPSGRRKTREERVMKATLASGVRKGQIIQFCNDQYHCLGTGVRVPYKKGGPSAGIVSL